MDGFFLCCSRFDEIEIKEILLRKYDASVFELNLDDFLLFCEKAIERDQDEMLKAEWNSLYPLMCSGMLKYVSYNDYKDNITGRNIDMRPTEVILAELDEVEKRVKGRV